MRPRLSRFARQTPPVRQPGGKLEGAAALTQLRSVWSLIPSSRATAPMLWPAFTRLTASPRNSGVHSCFGILFNFASPSRFSGRYTPSLGRRNFGGSSPDSLERFRICHEVRVNQGEGYRGSVHCEPFQIREPLQDQREQKGHKSRQNSKRYLSISGPLDPLSSVCKFVPDKRRSNAGQQRTY